MQDTHGISLLVYAAGIGHPKFSHLLKLLLDTAQPESLGLVCAGWVKKHAAATPGNSFSGLGGPDICIINPPPPVRSSQSFGRRASAFSGVQPNPCNAVRLQHGTTLRGLTVAAGAVHLAYCTAAQNFWRQLLCIPQAFISKHWISNIIILCFCHWGMYSSLQGAASQLRRSACSLDHEVLW